MQFLKLIISFFIILFLISCNSSVDKTYKADSLTKNNDPIIKDTVNKQANRQSLAGKIFLFAPELDSKTCTVTGACDCCSSNILFLSDSSFLMIDYCEANYSYSKGIYYMDNSSLRLRLDKLSVNKDYNWEKETDTTGSVTAEYFYKVENLKPTSIIYQRQDCNGSIIFKNKSEFGAIDKERTFNFELKAIKDEGIWTKIKMH